MQNNQLIVFSRTPLLGKVKKRLARVLGPEKALAIHRKLLAHSLRVAKSSGFSYKVYYSEAPVVPVEGHHAVQRGTDLGERMLNCFIAELREAEKVCLIGSDCYELTPAIIKQAFNALNNHDVVLGPAHDGGYYLIGLKKALPRLFTGIAWGGHKVLAATLDICTKHGLSYALLPTLNDIDLAEDVPAAWK